MSRPRAHSLPSKLVGNNHNQNWIKKLLDEGHTPEIVVLEELDNIEDLDEAEDFYIRYFWSIGCPLNNSRLGGDCGIFFDASVRKRMSQQKLGHKNPNFNRVRSPEHCAKISASLRGHKGNRNIKVLCVETGEIFDSLKEAAAKLKCDAGYIGLVASGKKRFTNGYTFKKIS